MIAVKKQILFTVAIKYLYLEMSKKGTHLFYEKIIIYSLTKDKGRNHQQIDLPCHVYSILTSYHKGVNFLKTVSSV